jgi:hypothetical protein
MVRRWHADPFGFLRPWNELPALMGSAPPATPPSTGTGVVTFLSGSELSRRPYHRHRHGRSAEDRRRRSYDRAGLSELLPAAEAGFVEALFADADRAN